MDRKKFIAVAISAALGLSGAPVYGIRICNIF